MWAVYILFGVALTLMFQGLIAGLREVRESKNLALNAKIVEVCGTTYVHKEHFRFAVRDINSKIEGLQLGMASLQNPILKKKGTKKC